MEVKLLSPHGYCKGVVSAISRALKTKKDYPHLPIYIYGQIVHNKLVNQALNNLGIYSLDPNNNSFEDLTRNIVAGVIVLTAHGTAKSIKDKIADKGLILVDTTCNDVAKSFSTIENLLIGEGDILYLGKHGHPEAVAALSIDKERIHLISNKSDIANLPKFKGPLYLTNQTTMSKLDLEDIHGALKAKFPEIIIQNEQCRATSLRQDAILNLDDNIDIVFVVGDKASNNSKKLHELASKRADTYLIESVNEIDISWLKKKRFAAVTSGASTPEYLTKSVVEWLSKFNEQDLNTHLKPALNLKLILKEFR